MYIFTVSIPNISKSLENNICPMRNENLIKQLDIVVDFFALSLTDKEGNHVTTQDEISFLTRY